jgi:4'-phosphopantetheinyl transferase
MYFSIYKINSQEMIDLLKIYVDVFDYFDLSNTRSSLSTRRACSLAMARNLIVKNHLASFDLAKLTMIQRLESGEPYLVFPDELTTDQQIKISISHSGTWCACLISHKSNPGAIDLEALNMKRNFLKIAECFFSKPEIEYVKQFGSTGFYRLWTAKEAIAKVQGKGLREVLKIQLDPLSFESSDICIESNIYRITTEIHQEYIYTIARNLS